MRQSEHQQPESRGTRHPETTEERLRREVADLKRQLSDKAAAPPRPGEFGHTARVWNPSALSIGMIVLALVVVTAAAFLAGYVPLRRSQALAQTEVQQVDNAPVRVDVIEVARGSRNSQLELPGNIQAETEAPILARADGYVRRRLVDIGDRVRAGQPVAEIEAPEVDQQILQARAAIQQAQAAVEQAQANLEQGRATLELARVTAQRWAALAAQGVVSRQENDQYQAQFQAQSANVQALEKAVAAQRGNVSAAEANLARLNDVQGYRIVKAPFDGVITLRNVDVGALVNTGSTLLFRIAQTGTLRMYVNVPETNASSVRAGQQARLSVGSLPGRHFLGTVVRTANSLDPASRTLLVEVRVPNASGELLPGMYAQVDLSSARATAPLSLPADALVVRAGGAQVAVVRPDHTVHFQKIEVGRDYGDRLEVLGGVAEGDLIIPSPTDAVREGVSVEPVVRGPAEPAAK